MRRRELLGELMGAIGGTAALRPLHAFAQTYPTRPVRLLVGYPAGGPADLFSRLIAQWLSEHLGRQFIVDNKPGAGSNIATEEVVRAAPDGHTLLYVTPSNATNGALFKKLHYDFLRDIAPVAGIVNGLGVMVVNPSLPVASVAEFIDYAKANPGKINVGTGGPGSASHLYYELFRTLSGVELVPVHYKGSAPSVPDLIAGHVQVMIEPLASSIGPIKSGKLRALAVTSAARSPLLPDVPPLGDFVPGYEAYGFGGMGAPRGTPTDVIDRLNREVNAALADATIKARITDVGYAPLPGSPADFAKFLADETEKWGKIIRDASIALD